MDPIYMMQNEGTGTVTIERFLADCKDRFPGASLRKFGPDSWELTQDEIILATVRRIWR